jgi:hypothetical protein
LLSAPRINFVGGANEVNSWRKTYENLRNTKDDSYRISGNSYAASVQVLFSLIVKLCLCFSGVKIAYIYFKSSYQKILTYIKSQFVKYYFFLIFSKLRMERERGVEEELCILVPPDQLAEIQGGDEKIKMLDCGTGTFINATATPSAELGNQKLRDGWQTYKEFEEFRRCEQSTLPLQEFLILWEARLFYLLLLIFFIKNSYRCL